MPSASPTLGRTIRGESVAKVGRRVFVFFGLLETDNGLRFTVKLRDSHEDAMAFEWVVPAGYGLDRGGWVSVVAPDDTPLEMITAEETRRPPRRPHAQLIARRSRASAA